MSVMRSRPISFVAKNKFGVKKKIALDGHPPHGPPVRNDGGAEMREPV
jgi:hypothetical protein